MIEAAEIIRPNSHEDVSVNGKNRYGNGSPRSPRTLNHGGDEILIYSKKSFLDHRESLVQITAGLMSEELGWSPAVALRTMDRGLAVTNEDLEEERLIPSVEVFTRDGKIIGVSAQRLIDLQTTLAGNIPFLQHLLRAFQEGYRGEGRGRFSVQQAQVIHDQAVFYGHRSQSAVGMYANQKAEIFVPGKYFPLEARFDSDPLAQEIMVRYYLRARANVIGSVNFKTGISKGDFPEPNKNYLPDPNHGPTTKLFERLQSKEFGMTFPGRDVLHGIGKLR